MTAKKKHTIALTGLEDAPVHFASPYHHLLYRIVLQAALDALDGKEDAVAFFGTPWFIYMADHLELRPKLWHELICRNTLRKHPHFKRYDWFREMARDWI